ncbi:hypothetical protein VNO78_27235 [Psophocarpus tetragonolobus]|uniref:Ubiquitin-like protease family profile domain-containing protein n=1 Tax=Psophocarpus tetragonolobus TaxID=3891 RepID=A0AAN9S1B0_PSOTE
MASLGYLNWTKLRRLEEPVFLSRRAWLELEGVTQASLFEWQCKYLQQQALLTNRSLSDYHFINTYFYKSLKKLFRTRFTPSSSTLMGNTLACTDKEDESGPIILHLDSLGLHFSRSVFYNIESYLIQEKNYMDREDMSSEVSIADRICRCLPPRIECQIIQVPQQKNEYDCGLFVLYFIERFMEEAPERLKKKDLAMFGKRWFKPEEASNLRMKIRKLLVEKLQNSISDNCNTEASPSSVGPATACVETIKDSMT